MCAHTRVEIKLCLSSVSKNTRKISFNINFLDVFPKTDSIEVREAARACISQTAEKRSKADLISEHISRLRSYNTARELQMFMPQEDNEDQNTSVHGLE